jgi:hypothetical protein
VTRAPILFLGPSASRDEIAAVCPTAEFMPPIQRDDLYKARERGGSIFLIVDGMFTHCLAVSPREIIDVIRDGALVFGASSMGAIRSAECWPAGMLGFGAVYRLYRSGRLDSDDEVAVSIDPVNDYAALSVALINVRYAVARARRNNLLDQSDGTKIVRAAQELHFTDRQWPLILEQAGLRDRASQLELMLQRYDLKAQDAIFAGTRLTAAMKDRPGLGEEHARLEIESFPRFTRYTGHDPYFGAEPIELAITLTKWLFGSGRYQPYIWSVVSGAPELREIDKAKLDEDDRAGNRRDALAVILARLLAAVETFAPKLWSELEFMDELHAELKRLHASRTLASRVDMPDQAIFKACSRRGRYSSRGRELA